MGVSVSTKSRPGDSDAETTVRSGRVIRLLSQGQVKLLGQIISSSNVIFLTQVEDEDLRALAVYKPRQGERPLWDFPAGTLYLREAAAYLVSRALGWPRVPPTVLRAGPYGPGAFQLYIDADPEANYFTLRQERLADLLPVAAFDVLLNNADRKGGHLLLDRRNRIWAIDNALTFHPEPKLRTVIWDFAGEPVPDEYLTDLHRLEEQITCDHPLRRALDDLLAESEIAALLDRLAKLLKSAVCPLPDPTRRQVPWPIV